MLAGRASGCRSAREVLVVIALVASVSALVTYHLTKSLPLRSDTSMQLVFERRMQVYDNVGYIEDKTHGLEAIFIGDESKPRRDTRQWSERKSNASDDSSKSSGGSEQRKRESVRRLYAQIKQVEERLNMNKHRQRKLALMESRNGSRSVMNDDHAMNRTGLDYSYQANNVDKSCFTKIIRNEMPQENMFCRELHRIQPLFEMVESKESLCHNTIHTKINFSFDSEQLLPECFFLPEELQNFSQSVSGRPGHWVLRPVSQELDVGSQLVYLNGKRWPVVGEIEREAKMIAQRYVTDPLMINAKPVDVKVLVLVTNMSPLRAYIYEDNQEISQSVDKEVKDDQWTISSLKNHLIQAYGFSSMSSAIQNIKNSVLQTLLYLDMRYRCDKTLHKIGRNLFREQNRQHGFQLLEFRLLLESQLKSKVFEIIPPPVVRKHVVENIISMVLKPSAVSVDIVRMAADLKLNWNLKGEGCHLDNHCLGQDDAEYIIKLFHEHRNKLDFTPLYPSIEAEKYSSFINELRSSCLFNDPPRFPHRHHSTADLHSTLLAIMPYLNTTASVDRFSDEKELTVDSIQPSDIESQYSYLTNCSEEYSAIPFLQTLDTFPRVTFTPELNPNSSDYYVTVPYELLVLQVSAQAQSCFCEARLDHKYGAAKPSNYTLGLGSNNIFIHVVDVTHSSPWIVNTYTLHIQRQERGVAPSSLSPVNHSKKLVCSLAQDCDFKFMSGAPCGMQNTHFKNWSHFSQHSLSLPTCTSGDTPGEWMVPCDSCSDSATCQWSGALWQPPSCIHRTMAKSDVQTCMAKKRVLFIGDSTNRGMMHYLMEQMNGTLTEWDKTHDTKLYRNLNGGRTLVSFAYYPQFWLALSQRPVFEKALQQLIKLSEPLENDARTVLVVGGVHWLATEHLTAVRRVLMQEGLEHAQVVVKTLGAGFHQHVDGLHCLTMKEQRKLVLHNRKLLQLAHSYGFDVVDTFNMTMSRYRDFLQGQCACHFHRVKEVLPSFSQFLKTSSSSSATIAGGHDALPITFHVEGDINAAYSDMLISRICPVT